MAKQRNRTRSARRRAEKERLNAATRERGLEAAEVQEDAKLWPRNARHCDQIDTLFNRGVITQDQHRAGVKFGLDFKRSQSVVGGRLIGMYEPMPKRPRKYQARPDTPEAIEAREAVEQAIAALGPTGTDCRIIGHRSDSRQGLCRPRRMTNEAAPAAAA